MKPSYLSIAILLVSVFLLSAPPVSAQAPVSQNQGTTPSGPSVVTAEVPRLIKFSGALLDAQNGPLEGPVGVTFALYAQQSGDAALWLETQNVKPDENGNYTVLLGANSAKGVPTELFTSGEARWLGVQVERNVEQPRVLLVSVPYALKAGDAETLGGLPSSAFARTGNSIAEQSNAVSSGALLLPVPAPAVTSSNASTDPNVTTLGGTVNFVPKFDTASDVKTSQIFDNGTDVGIGFPVTPAPVPVAKLDINGNANIRGALTLPPTGIATSTLGDNSQPLKQTASAYNSSTKLPVPQTFQWQAEPVGNDTSTPSGKLNLLFAPGTASPGETGLSINNKGQITFASGQTFPTVTGNETVTGNLSAKQLVSTVASGTPPLQVTSATQVPNLNASLLGGFAASAFARLAISNEFLANQFILGNGLQTFLGNVGCAPPTWGIQAGNFPANCFNFALGIDGSSSPSMGTYINRPTGGSIHFKEANGPSDQMVLSPASAGGGVTITAPGLSGTNYTAALTASNTDSTANIIAYGIRATTSSVLGAGVLGCLGNCLTLANAGVDGEGGDSGIGVVGNAGDNIGVLASNNPGAATTTPALQATNFSTTAGALVFRTVGNSNCTIDVNANLTCAGMLTSNGAKPFKIDDPADPAGKYLVHVAVESSEMINIYTGNVVLDASGTATVQLPGWFQAENADFRYGLAAIGPPAPNLRIAEEVTNNQFKIAGGQPGQKVSWQITAPRQDAWAKANPLEPEIEKPANEQGFYVHPELYGQPLEKSVYRRNQPSVPKRTEKMRENQAQP